MKKIKFLFKLVLIATFFLSGATQLAAQDFQALSLKAGHEGIWCDKITFDGHEMTLEMWLNIDAATAGNGVYIANCANNLKGWQLVLDWDIWIKFSFRTPSEGWADLLIPRNQFVGKWGHLAVSVSATGNSIVYVNGQALPAGDSNKLIEGGYYGNDKDGQALQIGYWYDAQKPVCKIADFRIWSTPRTAAEISANYNKHLEGTHSGLYLNYAFDGDRRDIKSYASDPTGEKNTGWLNPEANWGNYFGYEVLAQTPANLTLTQIAEAAFTAAWQGTADAWEVELKNVTTNAVIGTEPAIGNSKSFTGLDAGSIYEVRVRAKNFVYSGWTSAASITLETFTSTAPMADILDIVFKQDGTAEDVSPLHNTVATLKGTNLCTYYNDIYDRYTARFMNEAPGVAVTAGYYRVDYANNTAFENALADGHTLEAYFMADNPSPYPDKEIKVFSSHESGGTGLMLGPNSRGNSIIFLPYVGTTYVWTNSGIQPQQGRYYHVVGVWNKQENKSYIYVDGELKNTQTTSGDFKFASTGSHWFGIGADASNSSAQACWKGDAVFTRVYDKALTDSEVTLLWEQIKDSAPGPDHIGITNIAFPTGLNLSQGSSYTIQGTGFATGDIIRLQPLIGDGETFSCNGTVSVNSIQITLPESFVTGRYRLILIRGSKTQDLGFTSFFLDNLSPPKIIAHRGYWDTPGSAQNSIAALQKAQTLGIYGSEFDVWITTDGKLVLNHDGVINGITIENATYDQIKDQTLSNGEKIPTLEDYLNQGKQDIHTQLILEIKTHSTDAKNNAVVAACVNLVQAENMTGQVEYIAFSLNVCKEILRLQPNAKVAYLNGDLPPQTLYDWNIKGIDYYISVLRSHPEWIFDAHELGMTVNVWTVNTESDMIEMIHAGVDYITIDNPVAGKNLTTYSVTFTVQDAQNAAITDAVVTLNDVANAAGSYEFTGIAAGTYSYSVTKAGYETATGSVTVVAANLTPTITLQLTTAIDEVIKAVGYISFDKNTNTLSITGLKAGEKVRVFDQQGRLCLESTGSQINLSSVSNGLYIVRAGAQTGKIVKIK
jgi:glycerophosphoryl diester phosphodiesterase